MVNMINGEAEWGLITQWLARDKKAIKKVNAIRPANSNILKEIKDYIDADVEELRRKLYDFIDIHDLNEAQAQKVRGIIQTNLQSLGHVHNLIKGLEKSHLEMLEIEKNAKD